MRCRPPLQRLQTQSDLETALFGRAHPQLQASTAEVPAATADHFRELRMKVFMRCASERLGTNPYGYRVKSNYCLLDALTAVRYNRNNPFAYSAKVNYC